MAYRFFISLRALARLSLLLLACLDTSHAQAGVEGFYDAGQGPEALIPEFTSAFYQPFGSLSISESVADDAAPNYPAWRLQAPSGLPVSDYGYYGWASPTFRSLAAQQGWWFRSHFRLPSTIDDPTTGMSVYLNNQAYLAYLDLDNANNLQARLVGSSGQKFVPLTDDGSGTSYHTLEIRAQPSSAQGMLYFDGEFVDSWSPFPLGNHEQLFKWGDERDRVATGASEIRFRTLAYGWGTPPVNSPADLNLDGVVNGLDLSQWSNDYGQQTTAGDVTGDGLVDGADLLSWQREGNRSVFAQTSATLVPEPAAAILLFIASAFHGRFTRRSESQ